MAALTVDCVVFGFDEGSLKVLLVAREGPPFRGRWALPGGAMQADETLEEAARRALQEATGIGRVFLEQLYTFGAVDRDPRERSVSVAYFALVKLRDHKVSRAAWFDVDDLPALAFDHADIVDTALARLKGKVRYQPIGFELLPPKFTLSQLQHLYETILERPLDKRNFRKKILSMDFITELDEIEQDVAHRAARLYSFDRRKYQQLVRGGFNFEI
jgi:8-oxo-dGTP diphosphatase